MTNANVTALTSIEKDKFGALTFPTTSPMRTTATTILQASDGKMGKVDGGGYLLARSLIRWAKIPYQLPSPQKLTEQALGTACRCEEEKFPANRRRGLTGVVRECSGEVDAQRRRMNSSRQAAHAGTGERMDALTCLRKRCHPAPNAARWDGQGRRIPSGSVCSANTVWRLQRTRPAREDAAAYSINAATRALSIADYLPGRLRRRDRGSDYLTAD